MQLANVKGGKTSLHRTKIGTGKSGLKRTKCYEHLPDRSKRHERKQFEDTNKENRVNNEEQNKIRQLKSQEHTCP